MTRPLPFVPALVLAVASCSAPDAVELDDEAFPGIGALDDALTFDCGAATLCSGGGEAYGSAYRIGITETARAELLQSFVPAEDADATSLTLALRALRPFTSTGPVILHAKIYAVAASDALSLEGLTPVASGTHDLNGAGAFGTVTIPLSGTMLTAGAAYSLALWTEDLPAGSTGSLLVGVGAIATASSTFQGAAFGTFRRSLRRASAGSSFGNTRFRAAGSWDLALGLTLEPRNVLGEDPGVPGSSCKAILDAGASTGDKTYWIDPNGGDPADSQLAYCDMTNGGWTWGAIVNTGTDTAGLSRLPGVTRFGTAAAPGPSTAYSVDLSGLAFSQVRIRNFTANDEYVKTLASPTTWTSATYTSGGGQVAKRLAIDSTWEFRLGYYVAQSGANFPICFTYASVSTGWVCDADWTDILGMLDWSGGESCNQGNWCTYGDLWQQAGGSCIDHRSSAATYGFAVK